MKKFFKSIRKKSPARSGPPPEGSPKLDNRHGSASSLVVGYEVREKELGKLHKAAWLGDLAKVQQLAKKDPSPLDKENRTPLHLACVQGHEDIVQELLEWKAKTNVGDCDSRTPLMKAVECRHDGCVILLLRDKVELDSVDKDGNTSLHIAAADGSSKIAKMLCQSGANMTVKNKEGLAPLHVAVKEKQEEVCRNILNFRGHVDIEDNNLRTPLMYACQDGSLNLVKLFLDHGASTIHKDAKGWSADDCAVIQGHHACSQLISDHLLRQQRGSAASTPRSTAGSRSATPRGPSPFALPPTPSDSTNFGLPAADAGGDESGDETISKNSGKGAGSDSWGDDTDISLAEDKKGKDGSGSDIEDEIIVDKGATAKVSLAKLVDDLPSEGDTRGREGDTEIAPKRASTKSAHSQSSVDENSWAAADSPITPRKSNVRVSFKGGKELSEVHDITATESEGESDHYTTIPDLPVAEPADNTQGYTPSASAGTFGLPISPEKQRAFMEDIGLGDVDDISEFSDVPSDSKPTKPAAAAPDVASESEWDSTAKSEANKPGILKKQSKMDDASDWDTTEVEDNPPPLPDSPKPVLTKAAEWESDVEEMVIPMAGASIPKEVEVMMRKKQVEAQDSDEEDSSSQHNDMKAVTSTSDLLSIFIEQSAKEYLGNDSLDVTPQGDLLDKPSQDSEWDSTADAATPRGPTAQQPSFTKDSDWDSTAEAVTPRGPTAQQTSFTKIESAEIQPFEEEDDVEDLVAPVQNLTIATPTITVNSPRVEAVEASSGMPAPPQMEPGRDKDDDDDDDESGWDSDGDALPLDGPAEQADKQAQPLVTATASVGKISHLSVSDDDNDNTETVSEWEIERKQAKEQAKQEEENRKAEEEKKRKEEEEAERKRKEEEEERQWQEQKRLQQEEENRWMEEERKREEMRRREEEEKEQERQREELRQQQWEQEEAIRKEKLEAEAREALKREQEAEDHQSDSSGEELPAPEDHLAKPSIQTSDVAALNSCQNNSGFDEQADAESREHLKRVEKQIEAEQHFGEFGSPANTTSYGSRVQTSASGYGSPLQPQMSQGMPQASSSTYLPGPTALQIKQRLQIGTTPTMYHSDGMESDDSLASDNERYEARSSYPALLGSTQSFQPDFNMADDDVLSYTSTEFEGNDPVPTSTGPFARDVLLNMNLSDPSTLVQVQDYIRETKRHLEHEKNQRTVLDNKLRLLAREKQEQQRKVESMSEAKQALEQNKLHLEASIRSLEYNLSEEKEKKSNAELLLSKTKEQLTRKEQQFTNELEAKQRAELTMRNIQLEMRAAQNKIKELEEEREELERQLQHEHNARKLQEEINEEQSRLAQHRQQETVFTSSAAAVRDSALEDDGAGRSESDKLSAELYAVKMEMDRQRSRFKDEITLMATENEELQNRVEELKNEIKLNEEALAHATMQYNVQLGGLRSDALNSSTALDKEQSTREKLETELESLQKRLHAAIIEKDKAVIARNDMERDMQLEKQNYSRHVDRKEEEISMLKENTQHQNQRIQSLDAKLGSVENELHVSNTTLLERSNQLQQLKQEVERHKSSKSSFENTIRLEKEHNTKLQVKMEGLQERLTQSHHEVLTLKQQVETLRSSSLNAASVDSHEHLSTVINSLRSDSERTKALLEERNNSLMEQVQRLKEDSRNAENRRNTLDADHRRLQAQHAEVIHKLSFAEAQLQLLQKTKEHLELEKAQLKEELSKANERHTMSQEKCLESQTRLAEVRDRLNRAEHTSQLSTQNLATTSASFTAVARSKEEMEDTVQRLQVENAKLESDLRHERERIEMLQAELNDSHKVRHSLEALSSNLKSTAAHLEEKLGDETANRVIFAKEAKDCKLLLKHHMSTSNTLGQRIVHLEKAKKTAQQKIEQAKTQETGAEAQKVAAEVQLLEESQRNQQLQKEIMNLKAHLKAAKKKLKDSGLNVSTNGGGGSRYAEFKHQVSTEGGKVSTPRGENTSFQHNHYHHVLKLWLEEKRKGKYGARPSKTHAEELTTVHVSVHNLERSVHDLKTKMADISSQVESGFVDVESMQKEFEVKYRQEMNHKLEEINNYLEAQARARDRLDTSRTENESRLAADKRRLEEENGNLKLQYEQAIAQRESREMEARRFKQLYESEMQWRMRLSDQLQLSADKSLHLKPRLASDYKNRLHASVGNVNTSVLSAEASHMGISDDHNEALSNKIRAELNRSIAKHLEAAPHSDIVPVIRETEDTLLNHSLARSNKDYIHILKRKYCVS